MEYRTIYLFLSRTALLIAGIGGIFAFTIMWFIYLPLSLPTYFWEAVPGKSYNVSLPCGGLKKQEGTLYSYNYKGKEYSKNLFANQAGFEITYRNCGAELEKRFTPKRDGTDPVDAQGHAYVPVTVYVNPRNPKAASLVRGLPPIFRAVVPIILLIIGTLVGKFFDYYVKSYDKYGYYPRRQQAFRAILRMKKLFKEIEV